MKVNLTFDLDRVDREMIRLYLGGDKLPTHAKCAAWISNTIVDALTHIPEEKIKDVAVQKKGQAKKTSSV